MKIEHSWSYDAPVAEVYAMTLDRRFQEAKCRHAAAVDYSAEVTRRQDGTGLVVVERSMSTEGLPAQFRSLIGQTIDVVERQQWPADTADDGSRHADLTVQIKDAPVALKARIVMRPEGDGTSMQITGELRAKVPLFGGRIEEAAAPAITGAIEIEQQTGTEFLADAR